MGKVYRRRGRWWIAYRAQGREYRQSVARLLGVPPAYVTERDAHRELKRKLEDIFNDRFRGTRQDTLTVRALVESHLEWLALRGARSLVQLRHHSRGILEGLGHHRIRSLTTATVQSYAHARVSQGLRPATVNNELGMLRAALIRARFSARKHG